jgi:carboxyl-terminal processing protease
MTVKADNKFKNMIIFLLVILVVLLAYNKIINTFNSDDQQRKKNIERLSEVLEDIHQNYVDSVDWNESIDGAINGMLDKLDPHSVYIDKEEVQRNEENFKGRYYGIGIQFDVLDGYITVISVFPESPAEKAGLQAGDLITEIEGKSAYKIKRDDVPQKLKGEKDTEVKVTIKRDGLTELFEATITRGEIPIYALNTYFMQDDSSGYVWINRFAGTTTEELEAALEYLESKGMKRLVLDLRGNGGGYLREAVTVAGNFIDGHKLVVYTKGRNLSNNDSYYTDSFGEKKNHNYPLIVLIDYGSASASEIVAGALQDYDRALIVGKNSFGKGLVQNEFPLNNGARLRLTIAKYYTPSGRMIQKPYRGKSKDEYYQEIMGEDSSDTDGLDSLRKEIIFHTKGGRVVYGGGGIKPDVEIAYKKAYSSVKIQKMLQKRIFFEVGSAFANSHHQWKNRFKYFFMEYKVGEKLFNEVYRQSKLKNIELTINDLKENKKFVKNRIKAEIARALWGMERYWQIELQSDAQFTKAFKCFTEAKNILELKP